VQVAAAVGEVIELLQQGGGSTSIPEDLLIALAGKLRRREVTTDPSAVLGILMGFFHTLPDTPRIAADDPVMKSIVSLMTRCEELSD
jgi:hypothetical protein